MNGKAVHDTPAIQSLDRGLAILEAVAASVRPVPLRQLTDLIGIFHSHPDCDAYFSKTDLENSCPWYSFVVLSIQNGEFHHANSFLPDADQKFAEKEDLRHPR